MSDMPRDPADRGAEGAAAERGPSRSARLGPALSGLSVGRCHRYAIRITLVSLAAWLLWAQVRTIHHPWADLSRGNYTDHFSHMNAARVFPHIGLRLWKQGPKRFLPELSRAELERMPEDIRAGGSYSGGVYDLPGLPANKPWVTSWSHNPRLYPPGDLLLFAPAAALYAWTDISFGTMNQLLICMLLILAHVGLYFALKLVLREGTLSTPLLWFCFLLFYFETMHWALEGFYDVAVATPLLLSGMYLRQRRAVAAAVAYCAAAFLHFRALFFAPYALYAAWTFVQAGQWRRLGKKEWGGLTVMLLLCVGVLGVFALLAPVLTTLPVNNPVNLALRPLASTQVVMFLMVLAVSAVALVSARAWLDLMVLAWMAGMLATLREAYPWHGTILLTWLLMPVIGSARNHEAVRGARLLTLSFAAMVIFRNSLWPSWIELLWRA